MYAAIELKYCSLSLSLYLCRFLDLAPSLFLSRPLSLVLSFVLSLILLSSLPLVLSSPLSLPLSLSPGGRAALLGLSLGELSEQDYLLSLAVQYEVETYEDCSNRMCESRFTRSKKICSLRHDSGKQKIVLEREELNAL